MMSAGLPVPERKPRSVSRRDLEVGVLVEEAVDLGDDSGLVRRKAQRRRPRYRQGPRGAAAEADVHDELLPVDERHVLDDQAQHPLPLTGRCRGIRQSRGHHAPAPECAARCSSVEGRPIGVVLLSIPFLRVVSSRSLSFQSASSESATNRLLGSTRMKRWRAGSTSYCARSTALRRVRRPRPDAPGAPAQSRA